MSNEMKEIFENLEEGIIVLKNNTINFTNNNFIDILKETKVLSNEVSVLDDTLIHNKIFKLVRGIGEDRSIYNPKSSLFSPLIPSPEKRKSKLKDKFYSLKDIL